eukprot:gene9398-9562_t
MLNHSTRVPQPRPAPSSPEEIEAQHSAGFDQEKGMFGQINALGVGGLPPGAALIKPPPRASVVAYDASHWDQIDLEGQQDEMHPHRAKKEAERPCMRQTAKWCASNKVRIIGVVVTTLLLSLALGLGLGLSKRQQTIPAADQGGPALAAGKYGNCQPPQPRPTSPASVSDEAQLLSLKALKASIDAGGALRDVWPDSGATDFGYCKWKYVYCDASGKVVEQVNLTTGSYVMVLSGKLPPAKALEGLPGLKVIDIRLNSITGPIPTDWATLTNLEVLRLDQDFLQGPLPATLPPNLRQLTLWDNNITGPVPESIADLLDLEVLDLSYNELTGPLPDALSSLTQLREVLLDVNKFTGTIPGGWAAMKDLQRLFLSENLLTGTLPAAYSRLSKLREFWAEYNQLEGTLPPTYGRMTLLEKLVLNDNNLSGPVPATWGDLDNLEDIYLFNNPGLTGCLPGAWKGRLQLLPGFQDDEFLRGGTAIKGFCQN